MSKNIRFLKKQNPKELYAHIDAYMKEKGFELYNYQKIGLEWMLKRELLGFSLEKIDTKIGGGILGDEPGLGKTIQTCATMRCNPKKRTLIVVPKSVIFQWKNAINKILPKYKVFIYSSGTYTTSRQLRQSNFDVLITSYGMLYTKKDQLTPIHQFGKWDRIVLDEAHIIRNSKSKIHKSISFLQSPIKWCLTGTPVQNSHKDLCSLYKFLGLPDFYMDYVKVINKSLLLKRGKEIFKLLNISLPKLNHIDYILDFNSEKERDFYSKLKSNILENYLTLLDESNNKKIVYLELLLRLRQISIHPEIAINRLNAKFDMKIPNFLGYSTKIQKLIELIHAKKNQYCIVFSYFKKEMDIIGNYLNSNKIGFRTYHGGTSSKERHQVLNMFPDRDIINTIGKKFCLEDNITQKIYSYFPKVLLIQINAGGVGLNLQQFSQVFITSPNWNPSNEIQAIARAHRLGQKKPVFVHRLLLFDQQDEFNTIDEHITEKQTDKKLIMSDILDDKKYVDMSNVEFNVKSMRNKDLANKLIENLSINI